MESQREIERQYNKVLNDVKTNEFYQVDLTNRVNCYVCDCGHITKTKDIDAGVTPFIFRCERCGGMAKSTFYKDVAPDKIPTFEWFRPTLRQVLKMRKNPTMLEHILKGGLDYRKC
jgi:hypothetical protein